MFFALDLYSVVYKLFGDIFFLYFLYLIVVSFISTIFIHCRCFTNLIRADEAPFLLYGLKNLAVPIRLMAMGRMGIVNTVNDQK